MPRARNIKHSFFMNDDLAEHNSALGRLFFIGLWTVADYKGDVVWKPGRLKAELLPYDKCDIKEIAINLDNSGFIRFYSSQGNTYINVPAFSKHQNPHKNEKAKGSDIPKYSKESRQAIDLEGLTINRDKSRLNQECSHTAPADSCILIPDSCNLIPEKKESEINLTECFEQLWKTFDSGFGSKGSKKNALSVFKRLKPDKKLFDLMLSGLVSQLREKSTARDSNNFSEPFQHVERWIRNERWTDEASKRVISNRPESRHEQNARETREVLASLEGEASQDVEHIVQQGIGYDQNF